MPPAALGALALLAACGTQLTAADFDPTSAAPTPTAQPATACDVTGVASTARATAQYDPNSLALQRLLIDDGAGNLIAIENDPEAPGGIAAGATVTRTLDASAGGANRCALCVRARRAGDVSYTIAAGQLTLTAPSESGDVMHVSFKDVVFAHASANGPITAWCVSSYEASSSALPWACVDFGLRDGAYACWSDGFNGADLLCIGASLGIDGTPCHGADCAATEAAPNCEAATLF